MGRNSCRLEMALPAPVRPPNRLGAAPLARLRVQTTGGVGPVQVAWRPPGVRAGREAAAAGWGGSGPAASSCSPPAWGSAGRAGRSEVRAPPSLPRPFPGRPRAESARRGWVASGAEGAGRGPLCPGGLVPRRSRLSRSGRALVPERGAGGGDRSGPRRDVGAAAENLRVPAPRGRAPRIPARPGRHREGPGPRIRGVTALVLVALGLAE